MSQTDPERKRRVRYRGTHPRRFNEKYKELNPETYAADIAKVLARGQTPVGMHRSICVAEVLSVLNPKPGETGLDATLGFGGHAAELLRRIVPGGRLFGIDVDPVELPRTEARLRGQGFDESLLTVRQMNFAGILKLLPSGVGFDFILADLGVSSMQLSDPRRGFTFKDEGPLDLRLNPERGQPAAALLASLGADAIEVLLRKNADEPHAREIARAMHQKRGTLATTVALARTVRDALAPLPLHDRAKETTKSLHRTFQALRIAVNDEFGVLDQFLRVLPYALKPGGRVAILTFHSGEEWRVEASFAEHLAVGLYSDIAREAVRATPAERYDNPRSKAARLRWAVRAGTP